ncbi:chaperonin-containing T-complex member BBS12 [Halichoeres trimaculatus]|uniref:chaperonin-containing T-complex member BBS12 n=1 Tax=Halichoeres trimaculatus TaxID=147232 RepID=UPI003D9E4A56
MLGSAVINHRRHVGLQKLSALAGVAHSSLGPNKKFKFIQDDASGESALVCSCFRILENLELTCAVGQLVYETVRAHQKVYHSGSGCLLFLAGAWSRVALECLQRGISVGNITSAMTEGMDMCFNVWRKSCVSIHSLKKEKPESNAATSDGSELQQLKKSVSEGSRNINGNERRRMKLSRHFCEAVTVSSESQNPEPPDIAHIAECLSHGCVDAMNLVVEASRVQSDRACATFDVSKLMTCVLPGLPEHQACTVPGCILLLSAEQAAAAHHIKDQPLKVVLIDGDLSGTYRHLGFKRLPGVRRVGTEVSLSGLSKEEEWMEKTVTTLLNLEVNLILVSGSVTERVIQLCSRHHILVVEKVKVSVLKVLSDSSGAVPVTYATQLNKRCVGAGVKVTIWRELRSCQAKPSIAVNVSAGDNSQLVTVVLTSCVEGKLQALEDRFWACAYRLHHALKDEALLPGAGAAEMLCVHRLRKQAERDVTQQAANPYSSVILHLMADGVIDYLSTLMVNSGKLSKPQARTAVSQKLLDCNEHVESPENFTRLLLGGEEEDGAVSSSFDSSDAPSGKVYDNLSVKQEAWRKALDLVFLVLQTDSEIITGIDQSAALEENLMLL